MVFDMKDTHVKIRCNHTLLHKFIYSVTMKDKMNNWSQEIHSITPHINFKHIKEKNISVNSLSRLKCLGLFNYNYPEKTG